MFKKPVNKAKQGDRIGMCVTQFEASQLERGLVATPGYLPTVFGAIVTIKRISYYKGRYRMLLSSFVLFKICDNN
jgi:selenocysteine-specific elongation factor